MKNGWEGYECRWSVKNFENVRHSNIARLTSIGNLSGKVLLIWSEQGLGDTIQFSRYIQNFNLLGARLIFEVQSPLKELIQYSYPEIIVITREERISEHIDFQIPLLSLPRLFEVIPVSIPYLSAAQNKRLYWSQYLNVGRSKLNIGIACSGNMDHKNDKNRSIALFHFEELTKKANVFLIQKGMREPDQEFLKANNSITYLGDKIENFQDTAAIIGEMDLIISVDTSLVHLAGALGKPTILLLPLTPDWRWKLDSKNSLWYTTIKIFRQSVFNDWTSVINQVVSSIFLNKCD